MNKIKVGAAISVIRFLLEEVDEERSYNEWYEKQYAYAETLQSKVGGSVWDHMPECDHEPRQSIIKDDLKMIRRLALEISKATEST